MQGNKRSNGSFRFRLIFFSPFIANEDHRLIIRYTGSRMFMLEWVCCCCCTNLMQIDCIELEFRNQTEEFMPRNLLSSWPENVSRREYVKTMPDANVRMRWVYTWMFSQFVSWIIYALYDFIIGPLRFNWHRIYSDLCLCIDFKLKSSQSWSASVEKSAWINMW